MKVNRILSITLLFTALASYSFGQHGNDTIPCLVTNSVAESFFVNNSFWLNCQNSAGICFSGVREFSKVELKAGYEQGDYHNVFQPQSSQFYGFLSKGIKTLGKLHFMGAFDYNRDQSKGIAWSQMMDAERSSPLVIADSIGGDWTKDRYNLSLKMGSEPLWGWLHLGLGTHYAVGHGGRDNDPRPKSLTNSFALIPSVFVELSGNHKVGASYSVRSYKQDIDIANRSGVGSSTIFKIFGLSLLENPMVKSTVEYRIEGFNQSADLLYTLKLNGWNTFARVGYGLVTEESIFTPYKAMVDNQTGEVSHIPVKEVKFAETQLELTYGLELNTSYNPQRVQVSYSQNDAEAYKYSNQQVEYNRVSRQIGILYSAFIGSANQSKAFALHLGSRYAWQNTQQAFYAEKQVNTLNVNLRAEKAFLLFRRQSTVSATAEWNGRIKSSLDINPESEFIKPETEITKPVVWNTFYFEESSWASASLAWNIYLRSKSTVRPYFGVNVSGLKVINSEAFANEYRVFTAFSFGLQL